MRTSRVFLLALLVVTLGGAASQGFAAVRVFLRLDGLPGASTDANHRGWIECTIFDVPLATNELDGTVQPTNRLNLTRRADATSPTIANACVTGRYIKWACLAVRKTDPGAPAGDYFLATFFKNHVATYSSHGNATGLPTEAFRLQFGTVVWQYRQPGPKQTFGPLETGGYKSSTGGCYPHVGFEEWTGRRLGDPRLPLPVPVAFPVIAARAVAAEG